MAELNALPAAEFAARLGGVFEHAPWIAEAAAARRPCKDAADLSSALAVIVREAGTEKQLALLNAYPDLAARGRLTTESAREHDASGLSTANPETRRRLETLNAAYRARFGFPFIICARLHDVATILDAMKRRINHRRDEEFTAALGQVLQIARLRLADLVSD